jgi:hypothetical protein
MRLRLRLLRRPIVFLCFVVSFVHCSISDCMWMPWLCISGVRQTWAGRVPATAFRRSFDAPQRFSCIIRSTDGRCHSSGNPTVVFGSYSCTIPGNLLLVFVVNTVALGQGVSEAPLFVFPPVSYSTGAASLSCRCAMGFTCQHDKETSALRLNMTSDLAHSYTRTQDNIAAFILVHLDA